MLTMVVVVVVVVVEGDVVDVLGLDVATNVVVQV